MKYCITIIANKDIAIIANIALEYLNAYLLCVLNPIVLHCIRDINDMENVCNIDYGIPQYCDIADILKYCPILLLTHKH